MDPITLIVTALALGAAAGLKPVAEQAVKDAYSGVKTFIKDKYARVSIDMLENDPGDETRKSIIKADLEKTDAGQDEELLRQAQELTKLVQQYAPETAAEVNVKVEDIDAVGSVRIEDLIASGAGAKVDVDAKGVKAGGDVVIRGIKATGSEEPDPN